MLILLSHLSRRSQSMSRPGPLAYLLPRATPVIHSARPLPISPSPLARAGETTLFGGFDKTGASGTLLS
jgi:hypothetical protein